MLRYVRRSIAAMALLVLLALPASAQAATQYVWAWEPATTTATCGTFNSAGIAPPTFRANCRIRTWSIMDYGSNYAGWTRYAFTQGSSCPLCMDIITRPLEAYEWKGSAWVRNDIKAAKPGSELVYISPMAGSTTWAWAYTAKSGWRLVQRSAAFVVVTQIDS